MFQLSPFPIKGSGIEESGNSTSVSSVPGLPIYIPEPQSRTEDICSDQSYNSFEINYQTKVGSSNTGLDQQFLLTCILLLLVLLAGVGFVGYWILSKSEPSKSTKKRDRYLTVFMYGFGILVAIVIFFLFYLIISK